MEPAVLAAGAVALLGPYLRKAGEEFAGAAGRKVWEATRRLFDRLKDAFGSDPEAERSLARYRESPEEAAGELTEVLAARLAADRALATAVAAVLAEVKRVGADVRVVQRVTDAERVVGVRARTLDGVGSVEVRQEVDDVGTVTGVTIGDDPR